MIWVIDRDVHRMSRFPLTDAEGVLGPCIRYEEDAPPL
jgi:hypothetical protein